MIETKRDLFGTMTSGKKEGTEGGMTVLQRGTLSNANGV